MRVGQEDISGPAHIGSIALTSRRTPVGQCRTGFSEELFAGSRPADCSRFEHVEMEKAPASAFLSPACQQVEGEQVMKRSVGALGLLGLVYALALPAAHGAATVLWQPDLSKDTLDP